MPFVLQIPECPPSYSSLCCYTCYRATARTKEPTPDNITLTQAVSRTACCRLAGQL